MKFQKKYKPVTKKFWKFLKYVPTFLRKEIIRSQFELSYELSSDYIFKQAETEQEIEEALNIVYESYTLLGYIDQRAEKIHFNAFLCLPTTTILIIKHKDEVIGTMSILLDSAFGLPSERTWDLGKIKGQDKRIAEISSLSIKRSHKNSKGNILLMLCKLMYNYCVDILKVDGIVIAATQEVEPFYTDLLMFKTLVSDKEHSLVKGNKSTCCFLDFRTAPAVYYKEYSKRKKNRNLYEFFMQFKCPNIIFPMKQLSIQALLLEKNRSMIKILEKYPNLQQMFTSADKLTLANLDPFNDIEKAISFDTGHTTRVYPRISIRNIDAYLYHAITTAMTRAQIVDVSRFGFGLKTAEHVKDAKLNEKFVLLFVLNGEAVSIHAQLQWSREESYGFIVSEKSHLDWERFIAIVFAEINLPVNQARVLTNKRTA
ncbi:MAG: hypothetical protein K2Q18_08820 [Bdellovibrionales bacterium]|nr:hypothetical protein [Bdellovibrionales bacterium]